MSLSAVQILQKPNESNDGRLCAGLHVQLSGTRKIKATPAQKSALQKTYSHYTHKITDMSYKYACINI